MCMCGDITHLKCVRVPMLPRKSVIFFDKSQRGEKNITKYFLLPKRIVIQCLMF